MQLIEGGEVRLGLLDGAVERINHQDYRLLSPMDRPVRGLRRRLAFNQFEFLGALSDSLIFGVAIADVGYLSTAFLYLYDPKTKALLERSVKMPLGIGTRFVQTPESGTSTFKGPGTRVEMSAIGNARRLRVTGRGIDIDATFAEGQLTPQRICTRAGAAGWVFARKTAGHTVTGTIRWGARTEDLAEHRALGHHDWSAGYMRRNTFWNWGCLAGRLASGQVVGMNVSCGVNETSFTENCFWVDGRLERIGLVAFDYNRHDRLQPWTLRDSEGRLSLRFVPHGAHVERVDAFIVASNFTQLFGQYTGTLVTAAGQTVSIDGLWGYAEHHFARW